MSDSAAPVNASSHTGDAAARSRHDIDDWNRIAGNYASKGPDTGGRPFLEVQEIFWSWLGDLEGKSVLDVGCGHGWLSELLRSRGATVVGVDGSNVLLAVARSRYGNVRFLEHDLTLGLPNEVGCLDLAVAHRVLMDLPDIAPLLRDLASRLGVTGRLVFTIPHPCFFGHKSVQDTATGEWHKPLTSYLTEKAWQVETFGGHTHYHRSLTFYSQSLERAGFRLTRIFEPVPQPASTSIPHEFLREFPVFLLAEARLQPLGRVNSHE